MSETFLTITKPTKAILKDRGSKFLAYAFPIQKEAQVKPYLQQLRSEHPSARHVCYAYQLGQNAENYRANDDGEPNGSAGLPILNQIKSKGVTNTFVAVVRYFGGTKLGVPGLVNAYKEAAKDALEQASIIEKTPTSTFNIKFPHSSIGEVERVIRQMGFGISQQDFGMGCNWQIEVATSQKEKATKALTAIPQVELLR